MPYVTSIERLAKEEGRLVATQENVVAVLEAKFGAAGKRLSSKISKITDLQQLRELLQSASKAETLAEVRRMLPR